MNFPSGKPRRVAGGIRARSTRGAIGATWWSRRFVDVLEGLSIGGRLGRGRAYARAGQVVSLEVTPGTVHAVVQGTRPTPYRATIGLAPFPERVWTAVEEALAGQALYSARLLAGEMPPEIEEVFAGAGAPLFPTDAAALAMACTCPDWSVPCKHVAAALYLLAEAFDDDPFQILRWRGREREALLARLRELRGGAPAEDPAAAGAPPPIGAAAVLGDLGSATPADEHDRFWLPPVPLPPRPPTLPTEPDLVLRQLPAPPAAVGGSALAARLRAAYAAFAERDDPDAD